MSVMDETQRAINFNTLVEKAYLNEAIFYKFQRLEFHLLGARSMRALMHIVMNDLRETLQLQWVSLLLFDPEHVIAGILNHENISENEVRNVTLVDENQSINASFAPTFKPQYGNQALLELSRVSPNLCAESASMIQLPLIRHQCVIGCLSMSSADKTRFSVDAGTLFLERLASILSICIENSISISQTKLQSLQDVLTSVYNRRYFEERLKEEASYALRQQAPLSCVFLDIDHFKRINDTHGHVMGDEVLKEAANIIKTSLRKTDVLARYGGEEFIILLPDSTTEQAIHITERIRKNIALKTFAAEETEFNITLSAGVASFLEQEAADEASLDVLCHRLICRADKALYTAKANGRNQVVSVA